MASRAKQIHGLSTDEERIISVSMVGLLDEGDSLTGIPIITSSNLLSISNEQRNAIPITVNGKEVPANNGVQFLLSGNTVGQYLIEIRCSTTSGQTIEGYITVIVTASPY